MAYTRLTMVKPRAGCADEVRDILSELDSAFTDSPGLIFSIVVEHADRAGRISMWRSRDDANREAMNDRIMALHDRLHRVSEVIDDSLLDLRSGLFPEGFMSMTSNPKRSFYFMTPAEQPSLLAVS